MSDPLIIPGAIFPDCRPNGRHVYCLPGDGVYTNSGRLDLPNGQTLQSCIISEDGRVAGGGQVDNRIWLHAGKWVPDERPGGKFFQAIFDAEGKLQVYPGSDAMGYRYVAEDGSLVTCDESRVDPQTGLHDYVKLAGGITIGLDNAPGGNDSVVISYQGVKRTLCQGGECRWIRAYREGQQISVAFARQKPCEARMLWFAVDEIGEFPIWHPVEAAPPPTIPAVDPNGDSGPSQPPTPGSEAPPEPPDPGSQAPPEPPKPVPVQPVDRWAIVRAMLRALIARLAKR